MAILKLGGLVTAMSGKIGGQSISNRAKETTLRNIVHTNKTPSAAQSAQRYRTAVIANRYALIEPGQREDWLETSENYFYKNGVGDDIQRGAYGTFLFCNQNRKAINESFLAAPATYVAVNELPVDIVALSTSQLIVEALSAVSTEKYLLFAHVSNTSVANPNTVNLINCGLVPYTSLLASLDIIPQIENALGVTAFSSIVTFQIVPYNIASGNKFLYSQRYQADLRPV